MMINDPSFDLEEGEEPFFAVNVECMSDMFVQAIKDIKKGEELFMDYDMTDCPSDQDSGDNQKSDGNGSGEAGANDNNNEDNSSGSEDSKKKDADYEADIV